MVADPDRPPMPPLMDFILYFTTFGSMLVLCASTVALVGWALIKSARLVVRWARAITGPETEDISRRKPHHLNLDQLKRAGQ
jgi:hypothetical protein